MTFQCTRCTDLNNTITTSITTMEIQVKRRAGKAENIEGSIGSNLIKLMFKFWAN